MNKRLLPLLLLSLAVTPTAGAVTNRSNVSLHQLMERWPSRTISGAKSGSVAHLLAAFNDAWPTSVAFELFQATDGQPTTEEGLLIDEETGRTAVLDNRNGYACLYDYGTDDTSLEACVWQRSNGHKLFAVLIEQPVDPPMKVLCFYDYNTDNGMLTPEASPLADIEGRMQDPDFSVNLPQKGKDILVQEYITGWGEGILHVYAYDGQRHHYSHDVLPHMQQLTQLLADNVRCEQKPAPNRYTLVDIDRDGNPELWLLEFDSSASAVYTINDGNVELVAVGDDQRDIVTTEADGVICSTSNCGDGCYDFEYVALQYSRVSSRLNVHKFTDADGKRHADFTYNNQPMDKADGELLLTIYGDGMEFNAGEWRLCK